MIERGIVMNKYVKNEIRNSFWFVAGGIVLGILGLFQQGKDKKTLLAFCLAFVLIGIAQIVIYLLIRNKPEYIDNIKAEKEERSVFIRDKSGKFAFWGTFGAMVITSNMSFFSDMTVSDYSVGILIYMIIIYFGAFFYNLKKY